MILMSPTTYIDKEHSKRKHLFSQTIFSSHPIIQFRLTATCSTVSSTLYIPLVLSRKDLATEGSVSSITLSWLLWLELGSSLLLISCNTHNEIKWIKQEKYLKKITVSFFNCKHLKLQLRVFSGGCTVAMVTYCVTKMIATCSPMIEHFFDTMTIAWSDKEWLSGPIQKALETVLSQLNRLLKKWYKNDFVMTWW